MIPASRKKHSRIYLQMSGFIGERIKNARKKKKISQIALAREAEISVSYLCEIEHGTALPSIVTYSVLCRCLELEPVIPGAEDSQ